MAWSAYLGDLLSKHFFLGPNISSPASLSGTYLALVRAHGTGDNWTELSGNQYARANPTWVMSNGSTDEGYYMYWTQAAFPNGVQYAPGASGDWLPAIGQVLYDAPTGGNPLFDIPFLSVYRGGTPTTITVTASHELVLYSPEHPSNNGGTKIRVIGEYPWDLKKGGTSIPYSKVLLDWVFGTAVPYARTYKMAVGKGLYTHNEKNGLFEPGDWSECSGGNYQRLTLEAGNWMASGSNVTNNGEWVITPNATSDWGLIENYVLYPIDQPTIPAFWGYINPPVTISMGQGFSIPSGTILTSWVGNPII